MTEEMPLLYARVISSVKTEIKLLTCTLEYKSFSVSEKRLSTPFALGINLGLCCVEH